jgi:hypothetical protein
MANHNLSDVGELNEFDTMGATIGQVRIDLCRSASGQRIVAAIVLAGLLLLTACGGPAPAATSTATTTQAITPTATATPTTVLPPTATLPPPTATIVAPTATSAAPAYMADFATWFSGSESAPFPFRAGFDPASGEYRLALTDARRGYVYFRSAPDERTFGDFRLDIDARRVAGPDNGVYGVVFRIQPPVAGATTFERYNFTVTPEGFYSLNLIKTDGTATIVAPRTASPAINKGDGVNQLTVIARGTQLTLAINGQTIGTFSGPVIGPGGVGVYVGNPPNSTAPAGMEAGFSNLRIATAP